MVEPFTLTARIEHGVAFSVGGTTPKFLRTGTTDKVPPDRNFHAPLRANGLGPSSRLWLIADLDQQRNSPSFQQREVIMKKLRCLFVSAFCLLPFGVLCAQNPEADTKTPRTSDPPAPRLTTPQGEPTTEVSPKSNANDRDLEKRLSEIEATLKLILPKLLEAEKNLATKDELDRLRQQLSTANGDSGKPVPKSEDANGTPIKTPSVPEKPNDAKPPAGNSTTQAASLDQLVDRVGKLEMSITELKASVAKIGAILADPRNIPGAAASPSPKLDAFVIVRNQTGDDQTVFVEGKEFRIPSDGFDYPIRIKLVDPSQTAITQLWPYEKPKSRSFTRNEKTGKLEFLLPIFLRP